MTPDDALTQLVNEVFRLAGDLAVDGDAITAPVGLTAARWLVVGAVRDDTRTVAEIARIRGLRRQSVRESVQRLERDGLVIRIPNPDDARASLVELTPAGRAALEQVEPRRRTWAEQVARASAVDDMARAAVTLRALREAIVTERSEAARP